ncbi:hypothetical protein F53441_13009 [Fusarium austroafricanum]|uniref:Transcription factor domain-containing protein n=1 Tax=Fusarium austroafricanum TaxID=2364996 RepID=A0A8H4JRB5_9HYPO|nr:hypothetical protein F53441_13009 [Fusarium austroafricanum]
MNQPAPATSDQDMSLELIRKARKFKGAKNAQNISGLVVQGALDTNLQTFIRQVLREDYYQGSRPPFTPSDLSWLQDLNILSERPDTGIQIFNPLHLEVVRVFDQAILHHLSGILRSFPAQFAELGTTAFIHSGLYNSVLPPPLKEVRDICYSYHIGGGYLASNRLNALRLTIKRLLRSAKRASTFADTLAYSQALTLSQIIRLLECNDTCENIERDNEETWALTHQLWQHAPTQLPSTLTPWQAWLFSENVRRTIMVCNILLSVYSSLRRGYTMHSLCVEALPFDVRTRLWDEDSEGAWATAASKETGPYLVALSQFTALQQAVKGGTRFEDLLLSWFGK